MNGTLRIDGLHEGAYSIEVQAKVYEPQTLQMIAACRNDVGLTLKVKPQDILAQKSA